MSVFSSLFGFGRACRPCRHAPERRFGFLFCAHTCTHVNNYLFRFPGTSRRPSTRVCHQSASLQLTRPCIQSTVCSSQVDWFVSPFPLQKIRNTHKKCVSFYLLINCCLVPTTHVIKTKRRREKNERASNNNVVFRSQK